MQNGWILLTGASGGIGTAIAEALLAAGYGVIGLDLREGALSHPDYRFLETDCTSLPSVNAAFAAVSAFTDRLAGIVNAAGIVRMGSLIEEDPEWMEAVLAVNVGAMARVNRVFFPMLEKGRGRVINFSSEYGIFCSIPFHGYYTASKHAVECYSDSLRRELGYLKMKVCVIRPGAVDTAMTGSTLPQFERIKATTTHFSVQYRKLYPLMAGATAHPMPPERIASTVLRALTARRPRRAYNVGQDIRVKLLSLLPARLTDRIFARFFS